MTNKWVQFVKQYAREHNISYMCAATDKNCRQAYLTRNKSKSKSKRNSKSRSRSSRSSRSSRVFISPVNSANFRSPVNSANFRSPVNSANFRTPMSYNSSTYSDIYSPISDIDKWIKK
jgi:hypothetical protein